MKGDFISHTRVFLFHKYKKILIFIDTLKRYLLQDSRNRKLDVDCSLSNISLKENILQISFLDIMLYAFVIVI